MNEQTHNVLNLKPIITCHSHVSSACQATESFTYHPLRLHESCYLIHLPPVLHVQSTQSALFSSNVQPFYKKYVASNGMMPQSIKSAVTVCPSQSWELLHTHSQWSSSLPQAIKSCPGTSYKAVIQAQSRLALPPISVCPVSPYMVAKARGLTGRDPRSIFPLCSGLILHSSVIIGQCDIIQLDNRTPATPGTNSLQRTVNDTIDLQSAATPYNNQVVGR